MNLEVADRDNATCLKVEGESTGGGRRAQGEVKGECRRWRESAEGGRRGHGEVEGEVRKEVRREERNEVRGEGEKGSGSGG